MAQLPVDREMGSSAEPIRARTRTAIREYLQRMIRHNMVWEIRGSGDENIDCPGCAGNRALKYEKGGFWQCTWLKCSYRLPEEWSPPGPREIAEIFTQLKLEKRKKKLFSLADRVGVGIKV